MEFAIEKNIPLPDAKNGPSRTRPLRTMEVGDSFFVPGIKKRAQVGVQYIERTTSMRFTTRKEGDGLRVWRTE